MDKPEVKQDPPEEKFKKGDYSVHIFIEESKGLLPTNADRSFNPVISIKCFGKSKCTRILKCVTSGATSTWSEHIYFSKSDCTIAELELSKILIEVLDSRTLKNSLIGSYELDFTYVYFQPNHSIVHQWIILSNPYSEDITVQRGLIKLGVNILHESDKAEDLTAKGRADSMIIPPQVNVKSMQLIIRIIKAINLPKMDTGGTCDAYCVVSFATTKNKTKVVKAEEPDMIASWYQELWFPVCQPSISNKINLTVWDEDTIGKDEMIGSLNFNWENIPYEEEALSDEKKTYFWANIYGAPDGFSNEKAIEMNSNEKIASHWRGRILLSIFKKEAEKSLLKVVNYDSEKLKSEIQELYETESDTESGNIQFCAQVFEGVNLPMKTGSFSILIKFSGIYLKTKPVEASQSCCKWYESLKRQATPIENGRVLPDVFIYLIYNDEPICFARIKVSELADPKPKEKWIKLIPDGAVGKVKNAWEGGYVLLKVFVCKLNDPQYDKKYWEAKLDYSQKNSNKILVCNVYQCRNLPPADSTGLADPYLKFLCGASELETDKRAKEGILNPLWYESFTMKVSIGSKETSPPVIVQVWDYDDGDDDEIMGLCTVSVADIPLNPPDAPRPTWHKLSLGTKETEDGEILMSLMLVDSNPPPFFMPPLIEVSIEIYALGFRNLKPALGWLPVNKAFLKVDVRAAQLPGEQSLITELTTQPNNQGPNPNIGSVLTFKTKIPADPLFCPNLSCVVHDFLLSGKSQPILGTFDLDLHHVYAKKISEVLSEGQLKALTDKIEEVAVKPEDHKENVEKKRAPFNEIPMSLSESHQEGFVVVMPQFKPRQSNPSKKTEVKLQDPNYMALGYNHEPEDGKKHYRYVLNSTLEKSQLFGDPPFHIFPIKKGQTRGDTSSFFSFGKKAAEANPTLTEAGVFKGIVRIKNTGIHVAQVNDDGFEQIAKLLLVKTNCVVRVYVIEALNLEQMDVNSASDPYLVIKLGPQKISDREHYQEDQSCPKFNKHFDLSTTFPGDSTLKIQVWDHNGVFSDQKIGTLKIDLEDRFFNENWKKMPQKPIETGKLRVKSSKQPKGFIKYWVEIHPFSSVPKHWSIIPKPPEEFELRLVIWKAEGVPNMDSEGVSDLYVVASINDKEKKETDTHYRAKNGEASWNWRMKFKLMLDENSNLIVNLSLWDRDLLSSNDAIGDACLDLTQLAQYAVETEERVKKYGTSERFSERALRQESEKFFVEFKTKNQTGQDLSTGKVLISAEILPHLKAKSCMNGEGRAEPNIEPNLPAPENRVQLTMNPVKMVSEAVGPELRRKILMYALALCCAFVCVLMFPMLIANGFSFVLFY